MPLPLRIHHEILARPGLDVPVRAARRPHQLLGPVLDPAVLFVLGGLGDLNGGDSSALAGFQNGIQHVEGEVDLAFAGEDDGEVAVDGVGAHHDEEVGEAGDAGAVVGLR